MENAAARGSKMQPSRPPLMESAAPTSYYSSTHPHPPYLYSDSHYSLFYPHSQFPNPNIHPHQPYNSDALNSIIHPPGVDPNSALSVNPYANASSLHDAHQLGLLFSYPQVAASAPAASSMASASAAYYQDPNSAHLASYPYSNGVTIQPTVGETFVTANPKSASSGKRRIGLQKINPTKKGPKKVKVVQSAWCEVCKVDCNSRNVLDQHKLGKKHKKNLEKLIAASIQTSAPALTPAPAPAPAQMPVPVSAPASVPTPVSAPASVPTPVSAPASVPTATSEASDNTLIGPHENPDKAKSTSKKKSKKKSSGTEDLETKKKKMLEGGAAAGAVRMCDICNVVCNSAVVFRYHLAGQKHAAMMKKHASTTTSAATDMTTTAIAATDMTTTAIAATSTTASAATCMTTASAATTERLQ